MATILWQKFRESNFSIKNFTLNWFDEKNCMAWQWISCFSTLCVVLQKLFVLQFLRQNVKRSSFNNLFLVCQKTKIVVMSNQIAFSSFWLQKRIIEFVNDGIIQRNHFCYTTAQILGLKFWQKALWHNLAAFTYPPDVSFEESKLFNSKGTRFRRKFSSFHLVTYFCHVWEVLGFLSPLQPRQMLWPVKGSRPLNTTWWCWSTSSIITLLSPNLGRKHVSLEYLLFFSAEKKKTLVQITLSYSLWAGIC